MLNTLEIEHFIQKILKYLEQSNIDITHKVIDHIAYRTESSLEYEKMKTLFQKEGDMFPEVEIRGRRLSVFKLNKPLTFDPWKIEAVELLEPAQDNQFKTGWEHLEILESDLEGLINKYPNLPWNTNDMVRKNNPELGLRFEKDLSIRFHPISIVEARKLTLKTGEL